MESQTYGLHDVISTLDLFRDKGRFIADELIGKEAFGGVCISKLIDDANSGRRCGRISEVEVDYFRMTDDYLCDYIILKR